MIFVVTFVGFLIHLYSTEYMADDEGYSRFFAYMNLFVASMLMLVLADNLFLLYLGWEGVGLCSYLLIGFWYTGPGERRGGAQGVHRHPDRRHRHGGRPAAALQARWAPSTSRRLMAWAADNWPVGSGMAIAVALLLLGGAVGKSAQLPLQTWLPDAMAGPTPVSALIHAATMVTAGVYLIARTHVVFMLAPPAMTVVAMVGAATLLLAGCSALAQTDIKRVLAYSTISQIGYMFLGLGVGAWSAAVFHLMTHAFFKALLFLGAGAVIVCAPPRAGHLQDGRAAEAAPGGLLDLPHRVGLARGAAAGHRRLLQQGPDPAGPPGPPPTGSPWLWAAGASVRLLTAVYSFRLVFIVFFGDEKGHVEHRPGAPDPDPAGGPGRAVGRRRLCRDAGAGSATSPSSPISPTPGPAAGGLRRQTATTSNTSFRRWSPRSPCRVSAWPSSSISNDRRSPPPIKASPLGARLNRFWLVGVGLRHAV